MKNKALSFWGKSFTWGIVMSIIGTLAALGLILTGHKPKRFHYLIYFEVGSGWGGVNLGPFFIVQKGADLSMKQHEAGHGIQNTKYGLFQVVIALMSAARYWYRDYVWKHDPDKYRALPDYDAIWFEGQATELGEKYFKESE